MRLLALLLLATPAFAQEAIPLRVDRVVEAPASAQPPCNSHQRKWYKPLSSNMCQADYDAWVEPRLKDHWYTSKSWWAGTGIILLTNALDAFSTTSRVTPYYPYNIESNKLLGPHPSNGRVAAITGLESGFLVSLHGAAWHYSHQDPSEPWRIVGAWSVPSVVASAHISAAVHNFHVPVVHCPKGLTCK
jgi:hypothetical protein